MILCAQKRRQGALTLWARKKRVHEAEWCTLTIIQGQISLPVVSLTSRCALTSTGKDSRGDNCERDSRSALIGTDIDYDYITEFYRRVS